MSQREYDLCLFGATGFVGRLTAHYLAASAPAGTRIALGGRSRTKLESLQSELGAPAGSWALVVADSFDQAALGDSGSLCHDRRHQCRSLRPLRPPSGGRLR